MLAVDFIVIVIVIVTVTIPSLCESFVEMKADLRWRYLYYIVRVILGWYMSHCNIGCCHFCCFTVDETGRDTCKSKHSIPWYHCVLLIVDLSSNIWEFVSRWSPFCSNALQIPSWTKTPSPNEDDFITFVSPFYASIASKYIKPIQWKLKRTLNEWEKVKRDRKSNAGSELVMHSG